MNASIKYAHRFLVLVILVLAGCSSTRMTPESNTPVPRDTAQVMIPSPTHAVQEDTPSLPTPTASPTDESEAAAPPETNPIQFKQGGTSACVQRQLSAGLEHGYTVSATAGQTMLVTVASLLNDVFVKINGVQNGEALLGFDAEQSSWSGELPSTQEYQITLSSSNPARDYFLCVEIPALILIEPGKETIEINGYIELLSEWYPDVMTRVRYLLPASPGKTVKAIRLTSPDISNLSLGISGQADGQPYKRYEISGVEYISELPLTQGYFLDIYSLGSSTSFTLEIELR